MSEDDLVGAASSGETAPGIPAATVILLRDPPAGAGPAEALMLRKNAGQAFGGNWVFPGGKVEEGDIEAAGPDADELAIARCAAVREAAEETGLVLPADSLVPLSHWTPPVVAPKRYVTWFLVAALPGGAADVVVDGGEIGDHVWTSAEEALERHGRGEVELAPPTWVTLSWLRDVSDGAAASGTAAAVVEAARAGTVERYFTRVVGHDGSLVTMWHGDAGYDTTDATAPGPRHRLTMPRTGPWRYERD